MYLEGGDSSHHYDLLKEKLGLGYDDALLLEGYHSLLVVCFHGYSFHEMALHERVVCLNLSGDFQYVDQECNSSSVLQKKQKTRQE